MAHAPGKPLIAHVTRTHKLGDIEFTVSDSRIKSGGADDKIYAHHKNVWEYQPRGTAFTYVNLPNGQQKLLHILTGLRKFGNEDDNYTSDLKPGEVPVREYYTRKENGECFHLAAFLYDNVHYWIFGSKNVHAVVRDLHFIEDLGVYTEDRYVYFKEMGKILHNTLLKIGRDKRDYLFGSLAKTNCTFCAESCSLEHEHLVDYSADGGDQLRFFAMASPAHSGGGLTSTNPQEFQEYIAPMGLTGVIECESVELNDGSREVREALRKKVRETKNSEGAVVYVEAYNSTTKLTRIYQMYKYKNDDYVFERAIREQMRKQDSSENIRQRISNLHIKHPREAEMLQYFLQFNAWCRNELTAGRLEWNKLFESWVTVRKQFDILTPEQRKSSYGQFEENQSVYQQKQLMFIGPPGSGKSTIGRILQKVLPTGTVTYLNQDQLGSRAKTYHKAITAASKEQSGTLILDKCNHTTQVRDGTYNALNKQQLIYVIFTHPDGPEALLAEVTKRINSRSWGHLNLHPSPHLNGILNRFVDQMTPLTNEELAQARAVLTVDITTATSDQVQLILDALSFTDPPTKLQVLQAFEAVIVEEQLLLEKNQCNLKTSYWSLEVGDADRARIMQHPVVLQMQTERPQLNLQDSLHMTILYCLNKKGLDLEQGYLQEQCMDQLGKNLPIRIKGLCYDKKGAALVVNTSIGSDNKHSHITLATAPGVNPSYSNQMLDERSLENDVGIDAFPMNMSVTGTVTQNVTLVL